MKSPTLTTDEQIEAWEAARVDVARETDAEYLTDGEVVLALCRAWLGREGWDDVGKSDGRGGATPTEEIVDEEVPA